MSATNPVHVLSWLSLEALISSLDRTGFGLALNSLASLVSLSILAWVWGSARHLNRMRNRGDRTSQSHAFLASIVESSDDAIVSKDLNGAVTSWNPGAERIYGYTAAEMLGHPMTRLLPPERSDEERQILARILQGERVGLETVRRRKDGRLLDMSITVSPITDAHGTIIGASNVGRDITEHKRAAERFRLVVEAAPNAMVMVNGEGRIVLVNSQTEKVFGYTRDELIGQSIETLVPARFRCGHPGYRVAFFGDPKSRPMGRGRDLYGLRRDGTELPVEIGLNPIDTAEGIFVLAAIVDITERKRLEERFHATVELAPTAMVMIDRTGHITLVNRLTETIFGYDRDELLGQSVEILLPERYRATHPGLRDSFTFAPSARRMGEGRGLHGRRKDGSEFPVEIGLNPIETSDGIFVLSAIADITERKRAEEALRTFLATMSHEIRTPMNGVIGLVEVLARTGLSRDQLDITGSILESATALLSIINDILDFSKIEAGRLELEHEPVDLCDAVESLCGSLVPVAVRKNVQLSTFVSPRLPDCVLTDNTRLRQLLYNLVGNAIKFSGGRTGRQGHVSIRVEPAQIEPAQTDATRVAFCVTDNGIGMTPETLAHLFTPFRQAEVSTTRRYGGTGLGLAICQRLVALMQGDISVSSNLGEGSTFTVELPFETAQPNPAAFPPDLSGVECIVIETPTFNAGYLRAYLEHAGARVRVASADANLVEAVTACHAPTVVIHDGKSQFVAGADSGRHVTDKTVRQLVIVPGQSGAARIEYPGQVVLGGDGLRRQALLDGVAVAAGRASIRSWRDCAQENSEWQHATPPSIAEARAQGRLILVAEDDEINQKVILRQLGLLGYAAEVASDGAEAFRLWRENEYILLLTDLQMPEMDGFELAAAIRQAEVGPRRMPIVGLTANAMQKEASRAKSVGMDGNLTKPLQLATLKAVLDECLEDRQAAQSARPQAQNAPETPASDALDLGVLKALVGDDRQAADELLSIYMASLRRLAGDMRSHASRGEARRIGAIAHKLKSSSRSVGALALGDLCHELENAGRAEDRDGVAYWMARFEKAWPDIERAIEIFSRIGESSSGEKRS